MKLTLAWHINDGSIESQIIKEHAIKVRHDVFVGEEGRIEESVLNDSGVDKAATTVFYVLYARPKIADQAYLEPIASARINPNFDLKNVEINKFATYRCYRGMNFGGIVLQHAQANIEALARKHKFDQSFIVSVEQGIHFYGSVGYQKINHERFLNSLDPNTHGYLLHKKINPEGSTHFMPKGTIDFELTITEANTSACNLATLAEAEMPEATAKILNLNNIQSFL